MYSKIIKVTFAAIALLLNITAGYAQEAKWITTDNPDADKPNTWIEFRKAHWWTK